jgi:hypothetical protein
MTLQTTIKTTQLLGHKRITLEDRATERHIGQIVENERRLVRGLGKDVGVSSLRHSDRERYLLFTAMGQNVTEEQFPDLTETVASLGYEPVKDYNPMNEDGLRLL